MALAAEKKLERIGESCGVAGHQHDLIHDLSKRLDALWRYDQYIAKYAPCCRDKSTGFRRTFKNKQIDGFTAHSIRTENCFLVLASCGHTNMVAAPR
jgi:hypothetical protein